MNIFGIGLPEMALILVIALLVFGPKKLPEIGRSLGKALKGFQDASKEFEAEFKKEAERIEKVVAEPMKATIEKPEPKALSANQEVTDAEVIDAAHETASAAEPAQAEQTTDEEAA
ncbi:MAG: TatA/E family twin arginine-targeting protein translocase [Leptolyngbya sp. SIO4C1]|nr:TatA/E family twin arginine-targeting protein translocase [Leptolyngbya sp. SIO4C1]